MDSTAYCKPVSDAVIWREYNSGDKHKGPHDMARESTVPPSIYEDKKGLGSQFMSLLFLNTEILDLRVLILGSHLRLSSK